MSYSWQPDKDYKGNSVTLSSLPNGNKYKIRIGFIIAGVGTGTPCVELLPCPTCNRPPIPTCPSGTGGVACYGPLPCPQGITTSVFWGDESDSAFAITGVTVPTPTEDRLTQAIKIVEAMIVQFQELLKILQNLR